MTERPAGFADGGSAALLTHEHREVDEALEGFVADLARGDYEPAPVLEAMDDLRRHIYLEEALLFPPLVPAGLMMPVAVMLREHGRLWRTMDTLAALLLGGDNPEARRQAGRLCQDLLDQLDGHNAKEEQIIYASAETILDADQQAALVAAIAGDPLPQGWVCQDAAAPQG